MSRIYIDNPFPIELKPSSREKTCLVVFIAVNILRTMIAVVEANRKLVVIEVSTQNSVYSAENVVSVHFNSEVNDMLCFASEDSVTVVSGEHYEIIGLNMIISLGVGASKDIKNLDLYEQPIQGIIVGFSGQRIYCVSAAGVSFLDVPQSANILKAINQNDLTSAYRMACLGATAADWKILGNQFSSLILIR